LNISPPSAIVKPPNKKEKKWRDNLDPFGETVMEIKDLIQTITNIILAVLAVAGFIFGYIQYKKNRELERDKLNYEKQKDFKKELELNDKIEKEKNKQKSDTQLYRDHIIDKFQYLDFDGLNAVSQKSLKLEHIYVKLKTQPQRENNIYESIKDFEQLAQENSDNGEEEEVKTRELTDILEERIEQAQEKNRALKMLILGHPGSGKTTLMKWIALQCAGQNIEFLTDKMPIFIALKDLGKDPDGTFKNLGIEKLVKKQIEHESLDSNFFDRHFKKNEVIFLLDGLDEVADEKTRRAAIDWIKKQNIRGNTLIVTSRFSGIQVKKGLKLPNAWPVFCIKDFDLDDIELFLKNWYENVEKAMSENSEAKALKKAEKKYEKLIETIKSHQYKKLRELAVNPLLLTIIALVHRTRATLPKERHKLYEECVKVMIELWNVSYKNLDINFSVDNSINSLSKIAVHLMKENRREASLEVIESILPPEIEDHPVSFFLEEMVLKAGLLYKSEGQYGFLHLTFQEYLAAWNFSKRNNPEEILEYRDKDYWIETFKLFVNISNTRRFFNTVLERLDTNNYWRQMRLWEDCLRAIAIEDTQQELELKFARALLGHISHLNQSEINAPILEMYYKHYPIYQFHDELTDEASHLISNHSHPFCQPISALILCLKNSHSKKTVVEIIKKQLDDIDKISSLNELQEQDIVFRHHLSFFLILHRPIKLSNALYILNKLRISPPIIQILILRDLNYSRSENIISNPEELQNRIGIKKFRFVGRLKYLLYPHDLRDLYELLEQLKPIELKDLREFESLSEIRYLADFNEINSFFEDFYKKYKTRLQKNKDIISQWADQAFDRLHELPDEKLLEYFPGTTEEELRAFREERRQEKKEL
jgi:hypothetical protein